MADNAPPPDGGLSATEALRRQAEEDSNALPGGQRRSWLTLVRETTRESMFLLVLAAGTLCLVFGELQEGLILFGFVMLMLGLRLFQECKTKRAIEALRDVTSPFALVIRVGQRQRRRARGGAQRLGGAVGSDWVPADSTLISGSGLVWFQLLKKKADPMLFPERNCRPYSVALHASYLSSMKNL